MFQIETADDHIDLLARFDAFLTTKGSAFGLTYAGTGDGELTDWSGGADSVAETFTITASSASSFDVVGSVSGSIGTATVDTPFAHAKLEFLISDGATPFVAGDEFTLSTAPKAVNLRRALGCRLTATQGNAGVNAVQNLVDGKNAIVGGGSSVWQVSGPVTVPQDITIEFFEDEEITEYHLAAFSGLGAYCPTAWDFQYWDGGAWVTLDSRSGITGWGTNEVKQFTISSPVSVSLYRLHITGIPFPSAQVMLGALRLIRADGVDAAFGQMIWKALGNDGDSEIFFGVHPFERADADYYNWECVSFDGFTAGSRFYAQPGFHGKKYLPLWNSLIPYWFTANGRGAAVVAKVDSNYEGPALFGFGDQIMSPEQLPYAALLGAPLALGPTPPGWESTQFRYSNVSNNHRAITHSDAAGASTPVSENFHLSARKQDGSWEGLEGTSNDGTGPVPAGRNIIWPYRCGLSKLDPNLDGSYQPLPVLLNFATPNTPCQLPGIAAVSGQGQTAETPNRRGKIDWLAFPNIFRSDRDDYWLLALD